MAPLTLSERGAILGSLLLAPAGVPGVVNSGKATAGVVLQDLGVEVHA